MKHRRSRDSEPRKGQCMREQPGDSDRRHGEYCFFFLFFFFCKDNETLLASSAMAICAAEAGEKKL